MKIKRGPQTPLFKFPEFYLTGFFIEPQVAFIPALLDFAFFHGLADAAARLLPMGAVMELAAAPIGAKSPEGILQIFL